MSTVRIVAIAPHYAIRSFVSMVVVLTFTGVTITDAFSVSAPFRYQTRHSWLSSPLVAATTTTTIHSRTRVFVTPTDNEEDPTSAVLPPLPSTTTTTTTPTNTNSLSDLSPTEFILATEQMDPTTRAVVEAARKKQLDGDYNNDAEERSYPIDLPSPVLLASSMIFAIISTGMFVRVANLCESFVWDGPCRNRSVRPRNSPAFFNPYIYIYIYIYIGIYIYRFTISAIW